MLHSISDLTTFCRKTTGDVPAKLVGASTTVVGSKMYLFGGRLVTERRMVSDMYVFDLETFRWERIPPNPEDDVPRARYFHSADTWNNQLIIFGGMSNRFDSPNPDDLCVLNDVRFFDITTRRWLPSSVSNNNDTTNDSLVPRARYAHLSSVTSNRLFIIGGQDFFNVWLDDVCVYDLVTRTWIHRRDFPRHCGTYRSVAVASTLAVRLPQEELRAEQPPTPLGPPGTRFKVDQVPPSSTEFTASENLVHLPYSAQPTDDFPSNIYLYSNYNFTDVKRELEVIYPLPDADFTIQDRSASMSGSSFPPGLRFPTGAILGTHLIIAGTYLAHTYQSFSIWALDLLNMTWTRIDPGSAVSTGSWFRGCLWTDANKFLIFGNKEGNLVDDYNRRLLSWDHVAVVDLEAFGIYQPPTLRLDVASQELGLAALEEKVISDFEIVCDDGRKIPCSRKILEERWPWFKEQRAKFSQLAASTARSLPNSAMHVALPELPGKGAKGDTRPDPRLTPRSFLLSEPYPITLALLQYFYSMTLLTPLQHAPAVLSQLLVLSTTYDIPHLQSLVKHAMHKALSNSTSVGVYEVATLCSCRSLQIRALKTVMSYSQKRPGRSKGDKGSGDGRPPGSNGSGGGGRLDGGARDPSAFATRPRGTSDAVWRGPQGDHGPSGGRDYALNPNVNLHDRTVGTSHAQLSARSTPGGPSGLRVTTPSMLSRRVSVLSTNTDFEISAVAELLSPTLMDDMNHPMDEHHTQLDEPEDVLPSLDHNLDELVELFSDRFDEDEHRQDANYLTPISETFGSPTSTSSRVSSLYYDSDADEYDSPRYSRSAGSYIPFHLPIARSHPTTSRSADSDVPPLSSSTSMSSLASASRSQPYHSPRTPIHHPLPMDSPSLKQLNIIEEQFREDQEIVYNIAMEVPNSPTSIRVSPPKNSTVPEWPKKKSNIEWQETDTSPPPSTPPIRSPPTSISDSPISRSPPTSPKQSLTPAPSPRIGNPLMRFMSNTSSKTSRTIKSTKSQPDFSAFSSGFDPKQMKAEEKKRKKAEAKARVERLAQELSEKNKKRAENEDKKSIDSSKSRNTDQAAIFGGLSGLVM